MTQDKTTPAGGASHLHAELAAHAIVALLLSFVLIGCDSGKPVDQQPAVTVIGNGNTVIDGNCSWKDGVYFGDPENRDECERKKGDWIGR